VSPYQLKLHGEADPKKGVMAGRALRRDQPGFDRKSAYSNASRSELSSSNISHSITDSGKVP
jgi:hypothetical protein